MRGALLLRLLAASAALLACGLASAAPTTTAINPNGFGTTVLPPSGGAGVYNITGGTTAGSNLFHSFSTFNLGSTDTADFNVTSGISNILARVTGGPSTIDGKITSTLPGGALSSANLFFINPAGVMFTSNAQVNLGGSFVVSTANYVRLSDGTLFYGDINHPVQDAGLTSAPVSSFGFLAGTTPAGITINDGATFTTGGSLQFAGGDFTAGANTLSVSNATLGIFSGSQASATADGTVPYLTGGVTDYSTAANFASYGNVTLGGSTGGAALSASGSGGAVVIRGGKLMQQGTGGTISASSKVAIRGDSLSMSGTISTKTGSIGIDTTGDVTLTGGTITSQGGPITMGQMSLVNLTLDSTSSITETSGTGGTLSINSTGTINNAGTISTAGTSEPVQISAQSLSLSGTISTQSGAINVDTTGDVTLTGGAISSQGSAITLGQTSLAGLTLDDASMITEAGGSGGTLAINCSGAISNAGTISTAGTSEPVQISAQSLGLSGTISTQSGAINVDTTGDVTLTGGTISSQGSAITLGQTSLGNLSLDTTSSIDSAGGTVTVIATGNIGLSGGSIESTSSTSADAGNVNITDASGNITLDSGAEIASISSGSRNAGSVTVNGGVGAANTAKTISITGTGASSPNTGIFSISNGTGSAGAVNVTAIGNVVLSAGGQIASVATAPTGGNAQSVTLTLNAIQSALTVGGLGANATTPIPIIYSSTANPTATDGNVTISALLSNVELQPGAAIQTSSQDTVAGNISVEASSLTLDPYSAIQSVMNQTDKNDHSKAGKTGSVLVLVLNPFTFDPFTFSFSGPLSIADNAFIQTEAKPNQSGFNPLGQVTVYAGSLTEGGISVAPVAGGFAAYDYKIRGHTQIRMLNSLASPNGIDASSGGPFVEDLTGFSITTGTTVTLPPPLAGMGIILDGTLGGTAGPIVPTFSSPTYTYTITTGDGTVAGDNLFLSFSQFDLGINHPSATTTGFVSETALFDAPGIANIVARVTGGQQSQINGTLAEAMGTTANLFFLNPSGIMFTTNSSLNLNGALTLSTANSIEFGGRGTFVTQIDAPVDDLLTAEPSLFAGPVTVFNFTGAPKPVSFNGVTLSNDIPVNSEIQIIAGNITLDDGSLLNASQTLLFSAGSQGSLVFPSTGSLATFTSPLTSAADVFTDSSFSSLGTVTMNDDSVLTVPSPNMASTILIRAGTFNLNDSLIVDQTTADVGSLGGEVLVDVTGAASITSTSDSSFISTSTLGGSAGGSVQINAASLSITSAQGGIFTTGILSTAQPGTYYSSDLGYVPFLYSQAAASAATGNAGAIAINVSGPVTVTAFGQISTNTNGYGNAGTISIGVPGDADPQITVSGGSSITSSTSLIPPSTGPNNFSSTGNAGTVTMNASSLSVTDNQTLIATSAGTEFNPTGPTGNGGNILITVAGQTGGGNGDISIVNGGQISASSYDNGKGGTVVLNQSNDADGITIDGQGLNMPTGIFAAEFGDGNSSGLTSVTPAIEITTGSPLTLRAGGEISTSAAGNGSAGPMVITSGLLTIDGTNADPSQATGLLSSSTGASASVSNPTPSGNGGNITLNVTGDLDLLPGGTISASSQTVGLAGSVTITQSGSTDITDPALNPATNGGVYLGGGSISTAANGIGTVLSTEAGAIKINTQALTVNGGSITSSTLGLSKAGDITIKGVSTVQPAQFVTVENGGTISSDTGGPHGRGAGGTISILSGALTVQGGNSAISTSATGGSGNGGSIEVTVTANPNVLGATGAVSVTSGAMIASQTSGSGEGGTIIIDPESLLVDDATISTNAMGGTGNAGDITITATSTDPTFTPSVTVQNGGTIMSESNSSGSAGMVAVNADMMTVTGMGSTISTDAGAVGNAADTKGEIVLTGKDLIIYNYGLISATTGGFSPGGTITATISNDVSLSFDGKMDASSTSLMGGGNGGSILIGSNPVGSPEDYGSNSPYTVSLSYGGVISCDSQNTNGGNIDIHANQVTLEHGSLISTSEPNGASSTSGGSITIRAGHLFYLDISSYVDSNAGQGTGGNITIDPEFVILDHSGISAAGGLMNGNVIIDATYVFSGASFITATGTVQIDSVPLDLTGSLIALPGNLTSDEKRLREKCARAINHEFSSLIVVGRGGTESGPEEFQPDFGMDDALPSAPNPRPGSSQ